MVQALGAVLDVPVYAERPERPDESYVIVERTGSEIRQHINHARIAVQSYAPSMLAAIALNRRVVSAMQDLDAMDEISRVEVNSAGYNFTDPDAKEYRYQAVFDLTYYDDK